MNIIGAGVNWHDGYDNNPTFRVLLDAPLPQENKIYRSVILDDYGQSLSEEQMQAVGSPVRRSGRQIEILYRQVDFYVHFFKVGKDSDYPKGAASGVYQVEDADGNIIERKISSGWYISEAVVNNCDDLPEIAGVTYLTPKYRNLGLAGNILRDTLLEAVETYLPYVEIVPSIRDTHIPRIRGQMTKKAWREIKQVDLQVAKQTVCHDLGVDPNDFTDWRRHWEQVTSDPRYTSISKMEYSHLLGQTFEKAGAGLRCSLCGHVEMPDEQQERTLQRISRERSVKEGWQYLENFCKSYHCCRGRT